MDGHGVDMFSKLPDHILQLILSCLPTTEEVIRTSILSERWRYLWTLIPSIDIDYSRRLQNSLNDESTERFDTEKFEEFVYWVLSGKSSDLDSFRLHCPEHYHVWRVWRWIRMAVMKKVKLIDLKFGPNQINPDPVNEVPYCLVTCCSLEVLRLNMYNRRLTLPLISNNITAFPALRVLELNSIELTDGALVHHFLESCRALEELSIMHCLLYKLGHLTISCPNLKKLRIDSRIMNYNDPDLLLYTGVWNTTDVDHAGFLSSGIWISCPKLVFLEFTGRIADTFSFETTMDSLKKAVIHLEDLNKRELSYVPRPGGNIHSFFAQVSHAEFLSLTHYFIKELDVSVSLPNLKTLELTTTLDAVIMDVLIKFLIHVPHLESLHLVILERYYTDKDWNLREAETRRILAPHLKRVEFLEFKGGQRKLDLIRSLLEHGNVLEEMVFSLSKYRRTKSMYYIEEASKLPKACSTVKLIITQ